MRVYDRLAEAFATETTSPVFGMLSDWNVHWADAMHRRGAEVLEVRHEGAGLAMADGWARMSGKVGVGFAAGGPGLAQLATTMLVASRARTSIVAFVGDGGVNDAEHSQRVDQRRLVAGMEAGFVRLTSPDRTDLAVREAFYRARTESRPIVLSVPADLQQAEADDEPYQPSTDLLPLGPGEPNAQELDRAVALLAESRFPVILAGRGAVHAGAGEVVRRLAERTGALLATSLLAKNWLADDPFHVGISGLYSTATAMELLGEADCVLAIGASLNNDTTAHGYLYPSARFIHVDVRPHVLMGGGRVADVILEGDGRRVCELLESRLTAGGHSNTGYRTEKVATLLADGGEDVHEFSVAEDVLDSREVCRELDRLLPSSVGLVLGGGHAVQIATMTCNRPRDRILANQHFGCIGQGLTTAIGASLAAGRAPYFLVEGDAGLMMHLVEFDTAVRYGVPVLVVVLNDQGLGAEFHRMGSAGLDAELSAIPTPDLGETARALGGRGQLVRSLEELTAALVEFVSEPAPTIVDVRVSRDVMSLPYRRVLLGADE